MIFLGVHSESIFPFREYFALKKTVFPWTPFLWLTAESISLDTSGKPTVGFLLKITTPCWIILSIPLDDFHLIDWLLKSWWWILSKWFLFYCCKRVLIWQKVLEVFWRIYLNIIFWILLWMLTSLVIWNLNITMSTSLKYCYKYSLNWKLKLMGGAIKYFLKKLLGHEKFTSMVYWAFKMFFEKFVKPSDPPPLSYILNVRFLNFAMTEWFLHVTCFAKVSLLLLKSCNIKVIRFLP